MPAHTVPAKANATIPVDATVATGMPVSSGVAQAILSEVGMLHEVVLHEPVPGEAVQVNDGHEHTGPGDGKAIPREVLSDCWAVPTLTNVAAASSMDTSGWADILTTDGITGLTDQYRAADATALNAADTNWRCVGTWAIRLRAGAKGVAVDMLRGFGIALANTLTWRLELRDDPIVAGAGEAGVLDYYEENIAADEDAGWYDATGGYAPGAPHPGACLAVDPVGGTAISADGTYLLAISLLFDSLGGAAPKSLAYFYGVKAHEVT